MGIQQICDSIRDLFNTMRKPAAILPGLIMVCSLVKRPGLSVIISTSNIIRNQSQFGAPTGLAPDGSPNMMNGLIAIIVTEIFRALREDANIQVAIPPTGIAVTTSGANSGGPMISSGFNTNPAKGYAQMQ